MAKDARDGSGQRGNSNRGNSSSGRDNSSDSDWGGSSRSSRRNNDPTHSAYSPAGESAGSLSKGGWSEYDSGNSEARSGNRRYTSTTDRMNSHLSRYGSDNGYTKAFDSLRSGGFGGSAISAAVGQARNSFSSSKTKSLTGQSNMMSGLLANTPESEIESIMGAGFNEFIDNYDTKLPSGKTLGEVGFTDDFSANYAAGIKSGITGKPIETGFNSLFSFVGGDVSGRVAGKVGGDLGIASGMATGALMSKAGTAINTVRNAYNQKDLDESNKFAQDLGLNRFETEHKNNKSTLGTVGSFVGGLFNPVIGIGANFFNSEYATKKAVDAMSHIPGVKEHYDQNMQARIASSKESEKMKALDGGNAETGILSTMRNRQNLAQNNSSTKYNKVSYAIPSLANLWDNLHVQKG